MVIQRLSCEAKRSALHELISVELFTFGIQATFLTSEFVYALWLIWVHYVAET